MIVDIHIHSSRFPDHYPSDKKYGWKIPKEFIKERGMLENPPPEPWPDDIWKSIPEEKIKQAMDGPVEPYFTETEGVIDKAIIQGDTYLECFGHIVPNDYIADLVKKYPTKLAGVAGLNPTEKGAVKELERCIKELGLIGVGELVTTFGYFYPDDERCYPVWEKALELSVPVFIHAVSGRTKNAQLKYSDVNRVDDMARTFPKLKIILCHLGGPDYEAGIDIISKWENVYGDIAELPWRAGLDRRTVRKGLPVVDFGYYFNWLYPLLYYFSQPFGDPDKLLFGSDWRLGSPCRNVEVINGTNEMLKKLGLPEIPEQHLHNILHENWKRVFYVDEKGMLKNRKD
jgi:predicted TIM-barrel fold metal-dependent hydrolase